MGAIRSRQWNIAPPSNLITTGAEPMDRLTLYGSFTSSSSYKPMLYLALARLPFFLPHGEPQDRRAENA
jgi:hypothetical protein